MKQRMSIDPVDPDRLWIAVTRALEWLERTPLLCPDAALESLKPEAVLAVETAVQEYVALASQALRPHAELLPVTCSIVTEWQQLAMPFSTAERSVVLSWSMIDVCTQLRSVLVQQLEERLRSHIAKTIQRIHESRTKLAVCRLQDRFLPAYLLAIYDAVWPQVYGEYPSPFKPLKDLWAMGTWPVVCDDGEVAVYVPRGNLEDSVGYNAVLWNPIVASGLTALTSPFARSMTRLDLGEGPLWICEEVVIGRHPSNDLALNRGSISARHARLSERDGAWLVTDLLSTNGTYVNGERLIAPKTLQTGEISIGEFRLQLSPADEPTSQLEVLLGLARAVGNDRLSQELKARLTPSAKYSAPTRAELGAGWELAKWLEPEPAFLSGRIAIVDQALEELNQAIGEASGFARTLGEPVFSVAKPRMVHSFESAISQWLESWKAVATQPFSPEVSRGPLALSQLLQDDVLAFSLLDSESDVMQWHQAELYRVWPMAVARGFSEASWVVGNLLKAQHRQDLPRARALRAWAELWRLGTWPLWLPHGAVLFYVPLLKRAPEIGSVFADRFLSEDFRPGYQASFLPGARVLPTNEQKIVSFKSDEMTLSGAFASKSGARYVITSELCFASPPSGVVRPVKSVSPAWQKIVQLIGVEGYHWVAKATAETAVLVTVNGIELMQRPLVEGDVVSFRNRTSMDRSDFVYTRSDPHVNAK